MIKSKMCLYLFIFSLHSVLPSEVKIYFDKALVIQDIVTKEVIVTLKQINEVFQLKSNMDGKYYY